MKKILFYFLMVVAFAGLTYATKLFIKQINTLPARESILTMNEAIDSLQWLQLDIISAEQHALASRNFEKYDSLRTCFEDIDCAKVEVQKTRDSLLKSIFNPHQP